MKSYWRPLLLGIVVVSLVSAYIWYRRSAAQKRKPPQTSQVSAEERHGGPDDGNNDGSDRGGKDGSDDGDDRKDGPDLDRGANPGEHDPEGQPGEHGPRSEPVCIRPAPKSGQQLPDVSIAGEVTLAKDTVSPKGRAVTVLALVNKPVAQWTAGPTVSVYDSAFTDRPEFNIKMSNAPANGAQLCAFQTIDYQEFTYVHAAGCSPSSIKPGETYNNVRIKMNQLESSLELIGFSGFVPVSSWPGSQKRTVSGTVKSPTGLALVAVANTPIVDQPDVEANPGALALTDAKGAFRVQFLAKPSDPLYVCALGLPLDTATISKLPSLKGAKCQKVPVTLFGQNAADASNVSVSLTEERIYKMTDHEREHYSFLAECLK